jgi:hypothetical protein
MSGRCYFWMIREWTQLIIYHKFCILSSTPGWHNWLARETFKWLEISRFRVQASGWANYFWTSFATKSFFSFPSNVCPPTLFFFLTVEDGSYHIRCFLLLRLQHIDILFSGNSHVATAFRMQILVCFDHKAATWPIAATRTHSDLLSHIDHLTY